MITIVRFPSAVEVVKGAEARSTWKPGEGGIVRVTPGVAGQLVFETNKAGVKVTVWPLPGTVVVEENEPELRTVVRPALAPSEATKVDPPPARPIDKPSRKGR